MYFFFSILIAFYIAVAIIPLLRRAALYWQLTDVPDGRKVHENPTPRVGGIGIVLGAIVPIMLLLPHSFDKAAFLYGAVILVITGILDDLNGLTYKQKFLGQIAAAATTMVTGQLLIENLGIWGTREIILPLWVAAPLTLLFILGITNAINLADGLDGLAGGISIMIFSSIGVLAYMDENLTVLICCLSIIGALLAFLRYNTFPASIFMGDTGSLFLGFSAAVLCLLLTQSQSTAIAKTLPLIILGFPILDTLTVMSERMAIGLSPFKPDQRHFHHRLLKLGLTHKDAVLGIYIVQALMIFLSIQLRYETSFLILFVYLFVAVSILVFFYAAHRSGWTLPKGIGIDRLLNRLTGKRLGERLKSISLNTIGVLLPLGLIWLSIVAPSMYIKTSLILFISGSLTLLAFWLHRPLFGALFRLTAYALALYLLLASQGEISIHLPFSQQLFHHAFWGTLAVCVITYLLATRFKFFEITPFDYLILLVVISLPFLPLQHAKALHLGTVAGGMVVFLWSSEILLVQWKKWLAPLPLSCLAALSILLARYVVSIAS